MKSMLFGCFIVEIVKKLTQSFMSPQKANESWTRDLDFAKLIDLQSVRLLFYGRLNVQVWVIDFAQMHVYVQIMISFVTDFLYMSAQSLGLELEMRQFIYGKILMHITVF